MRIRAGCAVIVLTDLITEKIGMDIDKQVQLWYTYLQLHPQARRNILGE